MQKITVSFILRMVAVIGIFCSIALLIATLFPILDSNKSVLNYQREDAEYGIAISRDMCDYYALIGIAKKLKISVAFWDRQTGIDEAFDLLNSAGLLSKNIFVIAPALMDDDNVNAKRLSGINGIGGFILFHPEAKNITLPKAIDVPLLIIGSTDTNLPSHETSMGIYKSITGKMFFPTGRSVWTVADNIWLLLTPESVWGNHLMSHTTVNFIGSWLAKQSELNINIEYRFMTRIFLWVVTALLILKFLLLAAIYPQKQAIIFNKNANHNLYQSNEQAYYLKRIPWIIASIPLSLFIYFPLNMLITDTYEIHQMIFLSFSLSGMFISGLFHRNEFHGIRNRTHIKALFEWPFFFNSVCTVFLILAFATTLSFSGFWPFKPYIAISPQYFLMWMLFVIGLLLVTRNILIQNSFMRSDRAVVFGMLMIFLPVFVLPIVYIPIGGLSDAISLARSGWMFLCSLLIAKICVDKTGLVLYSAVAASLLPLFAMLAQYLRQMCSTGGL